MAAVWSGSTSTLGAHVVASLDKALYDDCLCFVASNKQQITESAKKSEKQSENSEMDNS